MPTKKDANRTRPSLWIRLPYYLGIVADALWVVALLSPPVFGALTGNPEFEADLQTRLIMGIGATLMAGWTVLLVWAVRDPIGRRAVILITAFPVVAGLFGVALVGVLVGVTSSLWLLVKMGVLMVSMVVSYVLARRRGPSSEVSLRR